MEALHVRNQRSRIPRLTGFIAKSTTRQSGGEQSAPMADFYEALYVASARRSRVGIRAVCNREETHRRGVRLTIHGAQGRIATPASCRRLMLRFQPLLLRERQAPPIGGNPQAPPVRCAMG